MMTDIMWHEVTVMTLRLKIMTSVSSAECSTATCSLRAEHHNDHDYDSNGIRDAN